MWAEVTVTWVFMTCDSCGLRVNCLSTDPYNVISVCCLFLKTIQIKLVDCKTVKWVSKFEVTGFEIIFNLKIIPYLMWSHIYWKRECFLKTATNFGLCSWSNRHCNFLSPLMSYKVTKEDINIPCYIWHTWILFLRYSVRISSECFVLSLNLINTQRLFVSWRHVALNECKQEKQMDTYASVNRVHLHQEKQQKSDLFSLQ